MGELALLERGSVGRLRAKRQCLIGKQCVCITEPVLLDKLEVPAAHVGQ